MEAKLLRFMKCVNLYKRDEIDYQQLLEKAKEIFK